MTTASIDTTRKAYHFGAGFAEHYAGTLRQLVGMRWTGRILRDANIPDTPAHRQAFLDGYRSARTETSPR